MKKFVFYLLTALLLFSFIPTQMSAVTKTPATNIPLNNPEVATKAEVLLSRLDELKAMDKSALSAPEKRALRKEVRGIKKELKETSQGVYLSIGAIVIIVLLLILLL